MRSTPSIPTSIRTTSTCLCFVLWIRRHRTYIILSCTNTVTELQFLDQRGVNDKGSLNDGLISTEWVETLNAEGQYQMVSIDSINDLGISQSCGTNFPIYLQEPHPALEDITDVPMSRTACLLGYDFACELEYTIQIRKCSRYLQYKLEQTVSVAGYCFELTTSIEDLTPAPDDFKPTTTEVKPFLKYTEKTNTVTNVTSYVPELIFKCQFDNFNMSLFYRAYWFINGNDCDLNNGPTHSREDMYLHEQNILDKGFNLGIEIQCGIRVSTFENSSRTDIVTSESFFAGIRVLNKTITIHQSDKQNTIFFETTVPIGCRHSDSTLALNCFQELLMLNPNKTDEFTCDESIVAVQTEYTKCGRRFYGELNDTDESWTSKPYSMNVKVTDVNYNDRGIFTILFKMNDGFGSYQKIWKGYEPGYVSVIVTKDTSWHYKTCQVRIDPHHTTPDDACYDNQQAGTFILYKNIEHDIEVQQRNAICNRGHAFCACGVVARAGRDVFMVNLCDGSNVMEYIRCQDNILDVRLMDDNLRYRVYFPHGSYMEIRMKPHVRYLDFLNIFIYMSPKDLKNTQGLCGYFDGDPDNDLRHRETHNGQTVVSPRVTGRCNTRRHEFATSWEVQSSESLFNLDNIKTLDTYDEQFMFCVCDPPKTIGAQIVSENAICSKSNRKLCTRNENFPTDSKEKQCIISRKRSLHFHLQEIQRRLSRAESKQLMYRFKRSEDTDDIQVSDENIQLCYNGIASGPVTKLDGKFGEAQLNASIDSCAYDVSVTNDTGFVEVHSAANNQVMSGYLGLDPVYRESNKEKVTAFLSQSCPDNCNDRGTCSDQGKCTCNEGYKGADCSIDISKGMIMSDIQGGGLCDLNTEPECGRCITFTADDLADGYTCRFTIKETYTDGTYTTSEEDVTGVVEYIFNGECCRLSSKKKRSASISEVVFITSYALYLSNDGINFGSGMTLFAYDSSCQMYTGSGDFTVFTVKHGYCFIEGSCVDEGSVSTSDACLSCSSQLDLYGWTSGCASKTNDNNTALIVGVCVGVVAGILLLIAMVFLLKYCKKDKQTVDPVNHTVNAKIKLEMSNSKAVYQRPPSASSTRDIDIGYELYDE